MIERIQWMSNFGIFRDFTGNDQSGVPAFKKRNLIYGWNYSGKTTISRLFQTLQFPDRPLIHSDGRFRITFSNNSEASQATRNSPYPIRVFNRDYIEANFQQEHTAPAVFIVGEENVALRNRLEALREAQERLTLRIQERQNQVSRIEREDNTAGTSRATTIGQLLGVRDFRRPNLESRISQVRQRLSEFELSEEQLQAVVSTFRSGDEIREISSIQLQLPDFQIELESVLALLRRTASFDAIEGLSQNRPLEDWLRTGLGLHPETGKCQFCESQIPEERLETLRRHFSTASQELRAEVNRAITRLQAIRFELPRIEDSQFFQELREDVRNRLQLLSQWLEYATTTRDSLVSILEQKKTSLETELNWDGETNRFLEGAETIGLINQTIRQHNEQIQNIETVKRKARQKIECHFATVHFTEQNIAAHEAKIKDLKKRIRYATSGKGRLGMQAQIIAKQIDRTARGAERFMELVKFLLRGSDINVTSQGESQFQLVRGTNPADRLSDGEKTAIAFAYFITSLEGDGEDLANTIIYVDDPISSLDSNHVYAVYALIVEKLHAALQLFVSTHNSEFFNLLKGLWFSGRVYPNGSEAFYIRRLADNTGAFSTIEKLPKLLRRFKSEYEFIFSQLHAFAEAETPSEHEAYTAPNLLRRFLEAYLGFRKPCTTAWYDKIDLILDSPEECREIHKLIDDASHLQNTGRALQQPSFVAIAQPCVKSVLLGLEKKDPLHYQSLIAVVRSNT